jgi:tetratricopeptide (TPR) repeat protein
MFRNWRRLLVAGILLLLVGFGLACLGINLWAWYHFRAGRSALEHYHTHEALPHFQAALAVWPKDARTLLLAARAARRLGFYEEAQDHLQTYRDACGSDDELILEQVLLRAQQGEVDDVETFCRARLEQDDSSAPLILEAMARGYMRWFRWAEADVCLKKWLEHEPENPQAFLLRGFLESERDNIQEAMAAYRTALQLDPELHEARIRLAESLLELIQAEEARPHLEFLRRRQPENPKVAVNLARCYDQLDQKQEADEILDGVLARQPHYAPALLLRGQNALSEGRTADAEKWLREACNREPGDYAAHYQLYLCFVQEGKVADAQKLQAQLKQIDDDLKVIHQIATSFMDKAPHDPDLMAEVGAISLRANAEEEGMRWLKQALKENPRHAPSHKVLADYYEKRGNARLAKEHREQAGPHP